MKFFSTSYHLAGKMLEACFYVSYDWGESYVLRLLVPSSACGSSAALHLHVEIMSQLYLHRFASLVDTDGELWEFHLGTVRWFYVRALT